jgi:rare lipoprotein A
MTLARPFIVAAVGVALAAISAHVLAQGTPAPAAATSSSATDAAQSGRLAWYGRKFAGHRTASGERYDPDALTMAHRTLPFGTRVRVTNPASKRSVVLRVNDRGPTQADRVGDVSLAAAKRLGMTRAGVIDAELTVISTGARAKP